MSQRKKQIGFRIATLLITGLLVLVLGEGVMRLYVWVRGWTPNCYAADLDLYQPHSTRGSEFRPDFRLRSGVFQIAVNRWGLRGPNISRRKPDGVTRIAILGGSSVFGYFVNDGQEAARLLETTLDRPDRTAFVGSDVAQALSRRHPWCTTGSGRPRARWRGRYCLRRANLHRRVVSHDLGCRGPRSDRPKRLRH